MMKSSLRMIGMLILSALLAVFLTACGGGEGDDGGSDSANLSRMDLAGAKALVIASRGTQSELTASAAMNEPEVLYKLTDEGLLVKVTYFDDSGNPIGSETYQPEYLEDLNEDYIYIRFSGGPWPPHYIVRKSTGEVFQMQHEPGQYDDAMKRRNTFQSEAHGTAMDGNAYYLVWDNSTRTNSLRRIELGSSGNIVDRRVSPEGDSPSHHDGSTVIAADGTIFYDYDGYFRVISSDGRVFDPTQEIISGQPEFTSTLLQGGPVYGKPFIGTDGAIYFQNGAFLNIAWNEMYWALQGADGEFPETPPNPSGNPITVYDYTGLPTIPYDEATGMLLDIRNPVTVRNGYSINDKPVDWDWLPAPLESASNETFVDQNGTPFWGYDDLGNRYRWRWYGAEIFSPVWRLTDTQDSSYRLDPYGGSMETNHRWLPDKAPAGILHYEPLAEQYRSTWWGHSGSGGIFLRVGEKILLVTVEKGGVFEVNNFAGRPIPVNSVSGIVIDLRDAESTDTHYYLLGRAVDDGQISLYRFDAATHTPTELIDGSEYELYKFTVTKDNNVVFRGVRRSDGADIGGTIDLSNQITIIEAIQNRDIVQLERVL